MRRFTVAPLSPFSDSLLGKLSALLHDMPEHEFEMLLCFILALVCACLIGVWTVGKALLLWFRETRSRR